MLRRLTLHLSCFFLSLIGMGQECGLSISGSVSEKSTGQSLPFAIIVIEELPTKGAIADKNGDFLIPDLCEGSYHLEIGFTGFKRKRIFVELKESQILNISLDYHNELLTELIVHGEKEEGNTQVNQVLNRELIERESHETLGNMLQQITGVRALKNGSGISKPVIHGLYGNRVTLLNNGIPQAGQQWGNDHAPEIDPNTAEHLSVIKGAAAIEYYGNAIGGVVLIEPNEISDDPHLHGTHGYTFQTNGQGHTLTTKVEKQGEIAAWRATGTYKRSGDQYTPDYYLNNTGSGELNGSLLMTRDLTDKIETNLYYSYFSTTIGILRGSHIGNLTDLELAISRDEPFFTAGKYSGNIEAPKQEVRHHLAKTETRFEINQNQHLKFTYAFQYNDRKEFDVRRSGRSNLPALSMDLQSHYSDLTYHLFLPQNWTIKLGTQFNLTDNQNDPETGILPLIPNYRTINQGLFGILQKDIGAWFIEVGARHDLRFMNVAAISRTVPRVIERFDETYSNSGVNAGIRYNLTPGLRLYFNSGLAQRPPEVNELYSYGLHQGVSGIEVGDPSLKEETSFKQVASMDWNLRDRLFFQVVGYTQFIRDYIFLRPENEFELTIRGAFPVFSYDQTDARLIGSDWQFTYEPVPALKFNMNYAMVRGRDLSENVPLIYMPSDQLRGSFTFFLPDLRKMENNSFTVSGNWNAEQIRLNQEQDFLAPPEAYFLLNSRYSTSFDLKDGKMDFFVEGENLTNTRYRDYLNRLRYFADEPGINFNVGLRYQF